MSFDFLNHLLLEQYEVQLRLLEPMECHFFHGPAINGLLCTALHRHPLGPEISLHPVELGRIEYRRGDLYPFALTLIGACSDLATEIEAGLRAVGRDPPPDRTFGRFEVVAFKHMTPPSTITAWGDEVTLQFVTPLRMERQDGSKGRRFLDPGFFAADRFLRLLHDRAYDLAKLSATPIPAYGVPDLPETQVTRTSLVWIDAPYHGRLKTVGGVVGRVHFTVTLSDDWRRLLELGQHLGVGRNTAMGFGRYRVNPSADVSPLAKARSFVDLALAPANLVEAFQHVKLKRRQPGSDETSSETFGDQLFVNLEDLATSIRQGTYQPGPLTGFVLPKPSGKIRALAVPTFRDRVAQRAVTQVLGPAFDLLLEESSFAYRKGLSRVGAAQAIARAYREGFRYILESDIESFFDNVDWQVMKEKLLALLPGDPVVDLIMNWVTQDVMFEGQRIRRSRGLPQGAGISPLLSNLYLDEFDEALQEDFRLVRYSDDFVVLCKSKEHAQQTLERAKASLKHLPAETASALFSPEQPGPNRWLTYCDLNGLRSIEPPAARQHKGRAEDVGGQVNETQRGATMEFDALSKRVIGCAIEVHRTLGPGLLESTYEQCLAHELTQAGISFSRQHPLPVSYKGQLLDAGYRVDLLIEESLIIELKSVDQIQPIHAAQILTHDLPHFAQADRLLHATLADRIDAYITVFLDPLA